MPLISVSFSATPVFNKAAQNKQKRTTCREVYVRVWREGLVSAEDDVGGLLRALFVLQHAECVEGGVCGAHVLHQLQHATHIPSSAPAPLTLSFSPGGRIMTAWFKDVSSFRLSSKLVHGCMVYTECASRQQQFYMAPDQPYNKQHCNHYGGCSKQKGMYKAPVSYSELHTTRAQWVYTEAGNRVTQSPLRAHLEMGRSTNVTWKQQNYSRSLPFYAMFASHANSDKS